MVALRRVSRPASPSSMWRALPQGRALAAHIRVRRVVSCPGGSLLDKCSSSLRSVAPRRVSRPTSNSTMWLVALGAVFLDICGSSCSRSPRGVFLDTHVVTCGGHRRFRRAPAAHMRLHPGASIRPSSSTPSLCPSSHPNPGIPAPVQPKPSSRVHVRHC